MQEEVAFRIMPRDYPTVVNCCVFCEFAFSYFVLGIGALVDVIFDFLGLHTNVRQFAG